MTNPNKKPMTDKQREARLKNLEKARGPKTAAGKERSSRNSTKHGGWGQKLWPIAQGPLREDPDEVEEFISAYIAELNPGDNAIVRQAALDLADKACRVVRAQRWEAQGYSAADYGNMEAASAARLRHGAGLDRRQAEAVRRFHDPEVSEDDLGWALCSLGFAVGMSEEDLDWVDDGDRTALVETLADLINEHFADQEEAASYLDARAADQEAQASEVEELWRPFIIRREMDESFARNAERLVSHASREFDRALSRYDKLVDRFGDADGREFGDDQSGGDQLGEDEDPEPGEDGAAQQAGGSPPKPAGGADGAADKLDIWSYLTADEVVDYLSNLSTTPSSPDPPPRNEPTDGSPAM